MTFPSRIAFRTPTTLFNISWLVAVKADALRLARQNPRRPAGRSRPDGILSRESRLVSIASVLDGGDVWIVCFIHGYRGHRRWWHFWCRDGFGHCFAVRHDREAGCWLLFDWSLWKLTVATLNDAQTEGLLKVIESCGHALMGQQEVRLRDWPRLRLPIHNCVTGLKHLLGIESTAITPWQLYCALEKRGWKRTLVPNNVSRETMERSFCDGRHSRAEQA